MEHYDLIRGESGNYDILLNLLLLINCSHVGGEAKLVTSQTLFSYQFFNPSKALLYNM